MKIRYATPEDLSALAALEAACFPPAEAADARTLAARLAVYPNHFWLLEDDGGQLISFIDGPVTNESTLPDALLADASLHREDGAWQAIAGVNTSPLHRRHGYAAQVMERVIADARAQGRKGCILACKAALIHYYERFGYQNLGLSASVHGGATWYDMRLEF